MKWRRKGGADYGAAIALVPPITKTTWRIKYMMRGSIRLIWDFEGRELMTSEVGSHTDEAYIQY